MKILLAVGPEDTFSALDLAFTRSHWTTVIDKWAMDAAQHLTCGGIDAVVMSDKLPNVFDVVRELRNKSSRLAIMVISQDDPARVYALFSAGADDVITRPVCVDDLPIKARVIARVAQGHADAAIRFGSLLVVPSDGAIVDGRRVPLSKSLFTILESLALRSGRVVSRDELIGALDSSREKLDARTIDAYIANIRSTLVKFGVPSKLIGTAYGRGYLMSKPYALGSDMPDHGAHYARRSSGRSAGRQHRPERAA